MPPKIIKKVNQDFFKKWSSNMAYILGFFVADGCITISKKRPANPFTFNITSADLNHLQNIAFVMESNHKICKKLGNNKNIAYQIQIRNSTLTNDLINLGIYPRKTYNIKAIKIPNKYFSDFVRGFFDGDGTVYIYNVNKTSQIKSSFISTSLQFIEDFNRKLCKFLKISKRKIHEFRAKEEYMKQYSICFYVDDSRKLAKFMYSNCSELYLDRKKQIFDKWKSIKRRPYTKKIY